MENILVNYNLAGGNKTVVRNIPRSSKYCLQAIWTGLTGTLNGRIVLYQSLDGVNFDTIKTYSESGALVDFSLPLSLASGSGQLVDAEGFTGYWLKASIEVTGITGGTLNIILAE